jgi:hypothetical protein
VGRRISAVVSAGAALVAGCAQISSAVELHTVVRPDARPTLREDRVRAVALEARWIQRGRELELELRELRSCTLVEHLPARQVERTVRRPDAMIFWEYGLAAVALGVSALAFARPELFAAEPTFDTGAMEYRRDPKTGYRLGGVFTAIGTGFLAAAIVDTVRARDRVRASDTIAVREGPLRPCDPPDGPAGGRKLELVVGERAQGGVTDADGRARFLLPELSQEPDEAPRTIAASVRAGTAGALPISLVVPFSHTADAPHTGAVQSAPH